MVPRPPEERRNSFLIAFLSSYLSLPHFSPFFSSVVCLNQKCILQELFRTPDNVGIDAFPDTINPLDPLEPQVCMYYEIR